MTLHREGYGLVTLAVGLAVGAAALLLWLETEMWLVQLVAGLGLLDVVSCRCVVVLVVCFVVLRVLWVPDVV